MLGTPLSMLMPERFRPMHDAGLRRVAEQPETSRMLGKTFEVVGLRADGEEFPIELSLATWETTEGRFFSGIIRDIAPASRPRIKPARWKARRTRSSRSTPRAGSCWPTHGPSNSSATSAAS